MGNKILKFIKDNWILLLILLIGFTLRIYKPLQLYMYNHDQDLAGWIIKDIVVNKHLRLIGQETSSRGVFIGPLFYYLQIPFYFLTHMDPSGTIVLVTLLGLFSIYSFYYCFSRMFGKRVGLIAAFIYAVSLYFVFADREVAPTMPVHLWTVWFLFALWSILKGKSRAYILLGLLLGLVWNFNLALATIAPLILVAQVLSKRKVNLKHVSLGFAIMAVTMSPFLVFEARHSFRQTKAIILSLTTSKDYDGGAGRGQDKLNRVLELAQKNVSSVYWGNFRPISISYTFYLLIIVFIYLIRRRIISRNLGLILALWTIIYILFFTLNPITVSEYYLNGINVVWVLIGSVVLGYFYKKNIYSKRLVLTLLSLMFIASFADMLTRSINRSGYIERSSVVRFIKEDSIKHAYPCVAVSYTTSPGYQFGYRYLFWLEELHVNQPMSMSPVYTIVFPHSLVNKIDKAYGALGLILPDYAAYDEKDVDISCSGENSNLTDPMFGYTE